MERETSNTATAGSSPELSSNILSFCIWHWMHPFISRGNKKAVQAEDLYDLLPTETTDYCERLWNERWETQRRQSGKASVWRLVILACGREMVWGCLAMPLWIAPVIGQVYLLKAFVKLAQDRDQHLEWWRAFLLVLGMFLTSSLQSLAMHHSLTYGTKSGMKIGSAVSMAVFNKMLRLRIVALGATSSGQMLNLVTNDTQKLFDAATFAPFSVFGLLDSLVVGGFALWEARTAALAGFVVIILAQFVQAMIGEAGGRMRTKSVKATDVRVRTIHEILSGIRVVKYNGWIKAFLSRIETIRSTEIKWITKAAYLRSSTFILRDGVTPIAALATFGTYVLLHDEDFSASKAFTLLGLYTVLVHIYSICPRGVQAAWESKVAIKRLQTLLDLPEGKGMSNREGIELLQQAYPNADVVLSKATFGWCLGDVVASSGHRGKESKLANSMDEKTSGVYPKALQSPEKEQALSKNLQSINFAAYRGELIAIVGAVGSFKSSLFYALLGEMECFEGAFFCGSTVSYAPQQPWIFNATVRDNILFGSDYDEAKYKQTIYACCLDDDLLIMPAGDNTEIGQRGINLSGGQKARISLARACYSPSEVLLLDDPLAAVDVPTARHLMEHVLGGILKGRTVILVTHNKASLELCDRLFLMENGTLSEVEFKVAVVHEVVSESSEEGNIKEGRSWESSSKLPSRRLSTSGAGKPEASDVADLMESRTTLSVGALTVAEGRVEGEVKWKSYFDYVKRTGLLIWALVMFFMCFAQILRLMVDYWVTIWVNGKYNLSTNMYLGVYAAWIGSMLVFNLARGFLFTKVSIMAAKSLHELMAESVLRSPQLFFDQNPVGRITNRFSKDQSTIEEILPYIAQEMTETLVGVLGVIVFIGVLMPWFLLTMPPFICIVWYCQQRYVVVSRELKRLDSVSRSPIYEHFAQTMQGLASVRAYTKQVDMHDRFRDYIDANHRAVILFAHINRWLGIRLDFASSICVTAAALLAILLRHSASPGLIGVVLLQSLQLTDLFQWGVRLASETETLFTSVERIQAYASLPSEADANSPPGFLRDDWPGEGKIEFANYTMAYREDLRPVLNDLTFKVHAQEKIGILGRTGAGKSSLAAALFRMVENSACKGSIFIDGIDIQHVGLDDLRLRLSIIPQDPVLFRGTVRLNLDPFELHSDMEIHEALAKVQLTWKITSLKLGLSSVIEENGDNFSVGQRQLLCLARSLLRKSKIIVMDEATAAVDGDTDKLIQGTMRNVFQFCTVLTIAHRIDTIIDSDRVLVLAQGGRISDFDSPINLLRHAEEEMKLQEGFISAEHTFAHMVTQSGPTIAKQLREDAENAERRRLRDRMVGTEGWLKG